MKRTLRKLCMTVIMLLLMIAFAGTVYAGSVSEEAQYVFYEEGLLESSEGADLDRRAEAVSREYDSGVYMVMVYDYKDWNSDLDTAAQLIYEDLGLGMREDQDGILLLLSMRERDYILLVHGEFANLAYGKYARDQLAEAFLDEFGEDNFSAGFEDYIEECDYLMSLAVNGEPLTRESSPHYQLLKWLFSLGLGIVVGLAIAALIRSRMRNVAEKTQADQYVAPGGVKITLRRDQFTHMTQTRVKIEKQSSGHSGGGGGYSSSSGKF